MPTYISMLRGINVGSRKVLMTDLQALYEKQGFKNIITYIQSGNVIFATAKKMAPPALARQLEQAMEKQYHFEVPVIIRTIEEMKDTLAANPFLQQKQINIDKLHVTFLAEPPAADKIDLLKTIDYSPDQFIITGRNIYLYCPNGYGITRLNNNFFENKLKLSATTRNWKTVNKLVELAGG